MDLKNKKHINIRTWNICEQKKKKVKHDQNTQRKINWLYSYEMEQCERENIAT